ncbi:extracellular solute-binding protein [Enterococcus sp. LJL98]
MKFKRFATTSFVLASAFALGACAGGDKGSGTGDQGASKEIVTEITEETSITFWHAMNGAQEEELTRLTNLFMEENPKIKVELQNQSSYPDLQAKINSTLPSPKDLPTLTQAYPGWLRDASLDGMLVDLDTYIDDETIGWGDQEAIIPSLMDGAKIEGKQVGIPFNKSTEMLFYNVDMFEEYDVEVPTNFEELKEVSKTIYEKSNGKVVGAGFDSLNNYYAIGMKNRGVEISPEMDLASDESKELINYYFEGVKEGYFRIAGSDKYLSGPFANEQLAIYIGSTAGEGYTSNDTAGKFEYNAVNRPEAINLQQGTDLYVFDSATAEQRTAAYLLMKFLATPESQLNWAIATGYMPIVESVVESEEYKNSGMRVPLSLAEATKELFSIPVIENGDAAYSEIRVIMENILANPTKDLDTLIEESAPVLESAFNQ